MKPTKFYLLMFFFVTLSLAGCGEKESPTPSSNTQTEAVSSTPQQAAKPSGENDKMSDANPVVKIETSKGPITLELDAKNAPDTVANFLSYVNDDFYNGTIFHRVIPDFMVQGGGMNPDMSEKSTKAPIKNEANNGLKNVRGTVAMARTNDPHSASSQFFVNVKSNDFLNFRSETPRGWGYAVFGKVTDGMDVVDQIVAVQTGTKGPHQDVPLESITIDKVTVQ